MRTRDLHRDVGAYALGVLDAAAAFRFEDHLMDCPRCALQLSEFSGVKAQLDQYALRTPAEVAPFVTVGPELLQGMLDRTGAVRRASHRRRLALAAVAAVLVVSGPFAVLGIASAPSAPAHGLLWTASDGATGTVAVVTASERYWGTDVALELTRPVVSGVCVLIAVGRNGSQETVMSWTSQAEDEKPLITQGGAALRPDRIDHFEVRTAAGHRLLTIRG